MLTFLWTVRYTVAVLRNELGLEFFHTWGSTSTVVTVVCGWKGLRVKFFLQWSFSLFPCKWDRELEGMTPGFVLIFGALLSKTVFLRCLEHNTSPFFRLPNACSIHITSFLANTHFLLTFSSMGNTWNVSPFNLEFGKQREAHPMAEQDFTMVLATHTRTLAAKAATNAHDRDCASPRFHPISPLGLLSNSPVR